MHSLLLPAEEDRSCEDTGEEGAVEGEKGGKAAEEGRQGGGGGRGERPASGGSPGERIPSSRSEGAGEDEREAAEEDLLQEEQNGQCLCLLIASFALAMTNERDVRDCDCFHSSSLIRKISKYILSI